jgi:hypothetical protein
MPPPESPTEDTESDGLVEHRDDPDADAPADAEPIPLPRLPEHPAGKRRRRPTGRLVERPSSDENDA